MMKLTSLLLGNELLRQSPKTVFTFISNMEENYIIDRYEASRKPNMLGRIRNLA